MTAAAAAALSGALWLSACTDRPAEPYSDELSEAASWLQGYVRIDTTNPPGQVEPAAAYLSEILASEDIDHEVLDSGDGRPSLWAELPATVVGENTAAKETLLLLHHLDVVEAGSLWRAQPFGGEVREGVLW